MNINRVIQSFNVLYRYRHSMYHIDYLPDHLKHFIYLILNSVHGLTLADDDLFKSLEKQYFKARLEKTKIMIKYRLKNYYKTELSNE